MIALCISSPEGHVGKTALCAGIAKKLLSDGKKVGYYKPVSIVPDSHHQNGSQDCSFAKSALDLSEAIETLCPLRMTESEIRAGKAISGEMERHIHEPFRHLSAGKDVVIIEGPPGLARGSFAAKLLDKIVSVTGSKLLVVLQYMGNSLQAEVEKIDPDLKSKMIGVVINGVPAAKLVDRTALTAGLQTPVFGVVPQDRALLGATVKELAEAVGARIVSAGGDTEELVENVMLGAAGLDTGPAYFSRKENKAVVVRGARPDMQLAALETPTKCLVLTGGVEPIEAVKRRAQEKKVPILVVNEGTELVVGRIEGSLHPKSFANERKLRKLDETLSRALDMKALYNALGI